MDSAWRPLGSIDPGDLVEGRLMLHHAAQLVTAPGRSLLDPRPDDSQTAFEWREDLQALVGEVVPGESPWRAALRPADLTLLVLDEAKDSAEALLLAGRNLEAGFAWLRERARERGADAARLSREVPYRIPSHPVAKGAAFPPAPLPEFAELARFYSNASRLFDALAPGVAGLSAVRCWPHHFDLGAIVTLEPDRGDDSPTLGFGLSPGDDAVAEPYWYVNLWPRPEPRPDPLPELVEGARWNTLGWLGAVLTGTALVAAAGGAAEQEAKAGDYLNGALAAARTVLGRSPD